MEDQQSHWTNQPPHTVSGPTVTDVLFEVDALYNIIQELQKLTTNPTSIFPKTAINFPRENSHRAVGR